MTGGPFDGAREAGMILIIDNYDSFTYNLVQRIGELGYREIRVFRNDKVTVADVHDLRPDHIIISPGPCTPLEAGVSNDVVSEFHKTVPILGVCLGHQCIGHVFGAKIVRAQRIMHGKTSEIHHDGQRVYEGLLNPFTATRYHSLAIDEATLPGEFEVTSRTEIGELMGVRHAQFPLEGVQFHPESFLTTEGPKLLDNFLKDTE